MTDTDFDVIVIGVGGIGSASVFHLAKEGVDVLGLEQYDIPHTMGSSHGGTRMIRLSYFNEERYVPLLRRAYDLWDELSTISGEKLRYKTGSLDIGKPDGEVVRGAKNACSTHNLEHTILSGDELNEAYPGFEVPSEYEAVYQDDGGFLDPEACTIAHVDAAHEVGGEVRARERVTDWSANKREVEVETTKRVYTAEKLVITTGAWAYKSTDIFGEELQPEPRTMGWFQPKKPEQYTPDLFPVYHIESNNERIYGFPRYDQPGVKIGRYGHPQGTVDPDTLDRTPTAGEEETLRSLLEEFMPDASGPTMGLQRCLITNTIDDDFIIDNHPDYENVIFGVGFSGHGFKLASAIGELISELSLDGQTKHDIDMFSIDRFD